eukprot:SAG31_NODE_434_length_15737_cov_10.315450_4_plen_989_part_00
MAANGESQSEQAQLDAAIAESRKAWLEATATARGRMCGNLPVSSSNRTDYIDLCSSDDEVPEQQQAGTSSASGSTAKLERVKDELREVQGILNDAKWPASAVVEGDDDVHVIVAAAAGAAARPPAAHDGGRAAKRALTCGAAAGSIKSDDDDDVRVEGHTGVLALQDFPHARENCVSFQFMAGCEQDHCKLCYCYVCDLPASACTSWASHCKARHADPVSRRQRAAAAAARLRAAQMEDAPDWHRPAGGTSPAAAAAAGCWSCERVLDGVTAASVYPREVDGSDGLARGVRLRTYQKQTLGFMLDRERSGSCLSARPGAGDPRMSANAELGTMFVRPERLGVLVPTGVRGGYIADEVGMGKTLCAISLVLANCPVERDANPMLADGNRVTVWFEEEEPQASSPPQVKPSVGVVQWSNDEGMQVKFDSSDDGELWIDATEDDWAWGDLGPPHVPAALQPIFRIRPDQTLTQQQRLQHRGLHGWIRLCKQGFRRVQGYTHHLVVLTSTLVIAPVSLLGQWADEIREFAPRLRVITWHSCAHKDWDSRRILARLTDARGWSNYDIVLTTSGMAAKMLGYRFHRIIVDEVHTDDVKNGFLFHRSDTLGVPGSVLPPPATTYGTYQFGSCPVPSQFRCTDSANYEVTAPHVWLLSGTPLTRGIDDLFLSAHLLGHADFGLRLHTATVGPALLESMKTLCIRHRKAQVIKGAQALSLPASETRVVWLTMSRNERDMYEQACLKDATGSNTAKCETEGAKDFFLEMTLRCRRQACSNVYRFPQNGKGRDSAFTERQALLMYNKTRRRGTEWTFDYTPKLEECTKLRALLADLRMLRAVEPDAMAVVFTHHLETHATIVELLKREEAWQVFEVTGSMDTCRRHAAIREFQWRGKAETGPKVLVVTIRVGAVGMTLSAASRVYLFEPAFNPAAEAQAAGRIHRLGQTRDVLITRFVFKDSIEENIVRMHTAIAAGQVQMHDGLVPPNGVRMLTQSFS